MSAMIEKVRSAKSGLIEACTSLLTGFEVSNKIVRKYHSIEPLMLCLVFGKKGQTEDKITSAGV